MVNIEPKYGKFWEEAIDRNFKSFREDSLFPSTTKSKYFINLENINYAGRLSFDQYLDKSLT